MAEAELEAALARGAVVVTPNKRLAREIVSRHDRARASSGTATWSAARVLPWMPFVHELVQVAQDAGLALPSLALDGTQAAALWTRVVRADLADKPLVDADAAAALAVEAWEQAHAYGAGLEGWRGLSGSDDVDAFVRWANAYAGELQRLDAIDGARAADALAGVAARLPGVATFDVLLAGFATLSPQQRRVCDALAATGARVSVARLPATTVGESSAKLVECATPRDELDSALDWARSQALRDPQARIGIVVLDLAQRRTIVEAACEDRLAAPLQWPGRHGERRPYDISLGPPLADVPLVDAALSLVALGHRPLDRARVARLVRSPYLPDAQRAWSRRAELERGWLMAGTRSLSWTAVVDDLAAADKSLAERWKRAGRQRPGTGRAAPRAWVERWKRWLEATGWCDGRPLSSDDYQADAAWNELLVAFVRLATVAPMLGADEALGALQALAQARVFQPASSGAQIRVLGLLEATGLAFDALWVAGMAADAWPRPPEPNPLLPIAWQRERGVPRASADTELAFARDVTAQLAHAAPDVTFSYAAVVDDHRRTPSPLLATLARAVAHETPGSTSDRMFAQRPVLESVPDATAPEIAAGSRLPGGAGLVDKVGDCLFRATAAHRLLVEPWPASTLGLTPIERGMLVHATLDAFWRDVRSHARLMAMNEDAQASAVRAAYASARATIEPRRWNELPPAVAQSEAECIERLVRQWLDDVERPRPPFEVLDTERRSTVTLGGYTLDLRIDRIDAVPGGVAVIDYKSGRAHPPARWFEARPRGMQAALYARASEQSTPQSPVRALVYGQLRSGDVKAIGLADDGAWPALASVGDVKAAGLADWRDAQQRLALALDDAARRFAAGEASIAPRDAKVCAMCGLHALCRVGALAEDGAASDAGFDDEE